MWLCDLVIDFLFHFCLISATSSVVFQIRKNSCDCHPEPEALPTSHLPMWKVWKNNNHKQNSTLLLLKDKEQNSTLLLLKDKEQNSTLLFLKDKEPSDGGEVVVDTESIWIYLNEWEFVCVCVSVCEWTSHGLPESSDYRKRGLFVISEFFRIVTSRPGLTRDTKIFVVENYVRLSICKHWKHILNGYFTDENT